MEDEACTGVCGDGSAAKSVFPDDGAAAGKVKSVSISTKPKMCKAEITPSIGVEISNPKDVKELTNKSLKLQDTQSSEDEVNDGKETLSSMSSEQLRERMHGQLKSLFEGRSKMNQMVSERRQWAYEMEIASTSRMKNNDETLKPTDIISCDGGKKARIHHQSQKGKKLHKPCKQNSTSSNETNEKLIKGPISDINNKSSPQEKENDDVIMSGNKVSVIKILDHKKESILPAGRDRQRHTVKDSNHTPSEKHPRKDIDITDNKPIDKVPHQEVKCEYNLSGNEDPELVISQSTVNQTGVQKCVSGDLVQSNQSTPSMRARWGPVCTADLENSPLETTASEMETTTSSDCVIVYREAGERKHWKKDCDDIVSLLAEAHITVDGKVKCDLKETKPLLVVKETVGKDPSQQQHKPAQMNSTFTLKEGLKDCEGDSCVCKTHKHTTTNVQKNSTVLSDTFKIDKLSFEKEMKSIGPPLLNSTFDLSKVHSNKGIIALEPVTFNSTYNVDKKIPVAVDISHQEECKETNVKTTVCATEICKERKTHKESLDATYTVSCDPEENKDAIPKPEENILNGSKVISKEETIKPKGSLLEKLLLHMTPQSKRKYQRLDHNIKLRKSSLPSEVNAERDTVIVAPKVHKKKRSMKLGLSGILQRLSSKHILKTPMRSKSVEMIEKDVDSYEDSDNTHSDIDSPQQECIGHCGTVKFLDAVTCRETEQRVTEHTSNSEDKNHTQESDDKSVVHEEKEICTKNASVFTGSQDKDFKGTKYEVNSDRKSPIIIEKETKLMEQEGTESNKSTSNSACPSRMSIDEMSIDSGVESQKTNNLSTDYSNSHILVSSSSGGSKGGSETGTCELQKTNDDKHDWMGFSNFSEAATSTVSMQSPHMKQEVDPPSTAQKCPSSIIQNTEVMKTGLLDATNGEKLQDISPVSTSNIHISVQISNKQDDKALQSQCEDVLDCRQLEQIEHESVTRAESNVSTQLLKVEQDLPSAQTKSTPSTEASNNPHKQDSSQSSIIIPVIPPSPGRVRPTQLNLTKKTTDIIHTSQDSASRRSSFSGRKQSQVNTVEVRKVETYSESQEHNYRTAQDVEYKNLCSEAAATHDVKSCRKELFSLSDEENEDLANLRQSMEDLLSSGEDRREEQRHHPDFWHLDEDGGVVAGGGGVYGWIEEQRAKLEDELSLDLFKKAYHLIEAAQEDEGCVVRESMSQVENLLGPCHHHLAYDILQLVVAESVYHN